MKRVIDRKATGFRIKELMDEKGVSSRDIATWLHINTTTVYKWRNGAMPETDSLINVAHFLGTTIDELIVVYPEYRH